MTASVNLAPLPKQRFTDNNGNPLVGGLVFTYAAGTTTKQATYTDGTGSTPNTNPVVLDSRGEAAIWLDQTLTYKFVVSPSGDTDPPTNPFWTIDGVRAPINGSGAGVFAEAYGANGNGIANNDSAIAAAIAAAGPGGVVYFVTPGGVYLHASPILYAGTTLNLNGCTLKYTGSAQQIAGNATGSTPYGGVINGVLDSTASTCTQIIQVRSGFCGAFDELILKANSATATAVDLVCNSTGTGDPAEGTLNTVGCHFRIKVVGTIGRVVRLNGNFSGGTVQQAVTLNTFEDLQHFGNCALVGIDEVQACDNNYLKGMTRIECNTANAVGRITNSSNPTGNAGVYANNADQFAVDTFGSYGGRTGWKVNYSKDTRCAQFFQNPVAENGALVVNGALSYDITVMEVSGTNYSSNHMAGINLGVGTQALPNVGCVVSFPATTGVSQYGTLSLIGPDSTVSTSAAYAGYVTTLPQAYTVPIAIGYFAPAAVKGAGSTITNDYGFYAQDRSAGNSNFGYYSTVTMGAGKWAFYGSGTAASQFGGLVSVNGLAQTGKTIVNNNAATSYNVTTAYNAASISYLGFTGTNAASIAFTFTAAASVPDGWRVDVYTQAAVGAVTWASSGATFVGAPSSLGAGSTTRFIYHAASTQWLPA